MFWSSVYDFYFFLVKWFIIISPFLSLVILLVLSWNSSTLATSCKELTHWKRLWCWDGLGAGGEEDHRGWDGWMASLTRWTWVWVNSGRWWWTGRPGVLRFMGSQRVGHDWATELNWKYNSSNISKVFWSPFTWIIYVFKVSLRKHNVGPCFFKSILSAF